MSDNERDIGKNLAMIRKMRGMNQSELAEAAQTTQATISSVETGKQGVTAHLLFRLSKALGVNPVAFQTGHVDATSDWVFPVHGSESTHARAAAESSRLALIGEIVSLLPNVGQDKLESLLGIVGAMADPALSESSENVPGRHKKVK